MKVLREFYSIYGGEGLKNSLGYDEGLYLYKTNYNYNQTLYMVQSMSYSNCTFGPII